MKLIFVGDAEVKRDFIDRNGDFTMVDVRNGRELRRISNEECQDNFMDYFDPWQEEYKSVTQSIKDKVKSGYMTFRHSRERQCLEVLTTYEVASVLTDLERECLQSYTEGQWSDGIGESFEQVPVHDGTYYISPWHPYQVMTHFYSE